MRRLVPVLVLLASLAPAAGAAPFVCQGTFVAGACAGEWDVGGDCADGSRYRGDGGGAGTPFGGAWAEGSSYCRTDANGTYEDRGVFVGAATLLAGAAFGWYEYRNDATGGAWQCMTVLDAYVAFMGTGISFGCRAGSPPAAEWGALLP